MSVFKRCSWVLIEQCLFSIQHNFSHSTKYTYIFLVFCRKCIKWNGKCHLLNGKPFFPDVLHHYKNLRLNCIPRMIQYACTFQLNSTFCVSLRCCICFIIIFVYCCTVYVFFAFGSLVCAKMCACGCVCFSMLLKMAFANSSKCRCDLFK